VTPEPIGRAEPVPRAWEHIAAIKKKCQYPMFALPTPVGFVGGQVFADQCQAVS
jgi:hypothetical protein